MRTPTNKKIANRIAKAAVQDQGAETLQEFAELIKEAYEAKPLAKIAEVKAYVIPKMIKTGMNQHDAAKYFKAANETILPYMNSGQKIAQADAQLDALSRLIQTTIDEGKHYLYDKEGNARLDTNVVNAATKVIQTKMNTLTKLQQNLIAATKDQGAKETKDFDLENADREQLERYLAGEMMDNPEIIEMISKRLDKDKVIEASWCE